jgi:murein DD-endopeptidase MepM/ murein hydrolase activator NlpD
LKPRKTLSSWLTNRYLLIIRNEENFAEKTTVGFTYAKLIAGLLLMFIVVFLVSLYLAQTLLAQWFDPRYQQSELNKRLINLSMTVDSLSEDLDRKNQFISAFQAVVSGDEADSALSSFGAEDQNKESPVQELTPTKPIDSVFREEFESSGMDYLSYLDEDFELQEIYFFSPLSGFVVSPYNPQIEHYGVDIAAKSNEPVKCVADGTVIFSDFDYSQSGYVVAVQHRNNIISIYKHNSAILKKVGNFVGAGEIISIIGNTGELTTGPHLHFELWYNGKSVDPEQFVTF